MDTTIVEELQGAIRDPNCMAFALSYKFPSPELSAFVKEFKDKFQCQLCGQCCDGTLLKYTCLKDKDLLSFGRPRRIDQPCQYQDASKKCSVYSYRPVACRSFPWLGDFMIGNEVHPTLSTKCPGVKKLFESTEVIHA